MEALKEGAVQELIIDQFQSGRWGSGTINFLDESYEA